MVFALAGDSTISMFIDGWRPYRSPKSRGDTARLAGRWGGRGLKSNRASKSPVKTGIFYATHASVKAVALPLFRSRWLRLGAAISDADEADQTAQETMRHQASSELVQSENLVADVALTTRETKVSPDCNE